MLTPLVLALLALPEPAEACAWEETLAASRASEATVDEQVATHAARGAELLGSNCAYSTGLMARRVIAEGRDWQYVGQLSPATNQLGSHVAAPFRTQTKDAGAFVVANELLESLVVGAHMSATLALTGRSLEVDGVTYVVLTSFRVVNS